MKKHIPWFRRGLNKNIGDTLNSSVRTGTAQFNPAFIEVAPIVVIVIDPTFRLAHGQVVKRINRAKSNGRNKDVKRNERTSGKARERAHGKDGKAGTAGRGNPQRVGTGRRAVRDIDAPTSARGRKGGG